MSQSFIEQFGIGQCGTADNLALDNLAPGNLAPDNLAPDNFSLLTIWHQDNLTSDNSTPWVKIDNLLHQYKKRRGLSSLTASKARMNENPISFSISLAKTPPKLTTRKVMVIPFRKYVTSHGLNDNNRVKSWKCRWVSELVTNLRTDQSYG